MIYIFENGWKDIGIFDMFLFLMIFFIVRMFLEFLIDVFLFKFINLYLY